MIDTVVQINIDDEIELAWEFLLEEENEEIFLFPFWRYFEYINNHMQRSLPKIANQLSDQSMRLITASNMCIILLDVVKRTLVWEFNLSQNKNKNLTVQNFLRNISSQQQLITLFNKYPVLQQLLGKIFNNYLVYVLDLFRRLEIDLVDLNTNLNLTDFVLHSFSIKGDPHCLGGRVSELVFHHQQTKAEQKIIYKPRDLYLEKRFNEFIQFLKSRNLKISLKAIVVIPKEQYGWMEYVSQETIEESEAKNYYYNLGFLLGICSVFNGQDIHFENIIASGVNPVIIDLECLFSAPVTEHQYADSNFPSVFDTLIIPFKRNHNDPGYDFSAVLNHPNQESFMHRFEVKGDFVTKVYIERSIVNIIPAGNVLGNRLTGVPFSATHYSEMIIGGFGDYLNWVVENKQDLIDFVTKKFSNLKSRILFRPTFIYTKVLLESCHPKLLSDIEKYNQYLAQLYSEDNEIYRCIYQDELFDLLNGDIPYFSTMTTELFSKNSRDEKTNFVTYCTGMERVIDKIRLLQKNDITEISQQIAESLKDRYV